MSKSQNPLQQLLILPTEAQNKLEQDSLINQKLSYQCEGQSIIINELSTSIPDAENIEQKISDIDSQIEEVNLNLTEAFSVLSDLLQQQKSDSKMVGKILSTVLLNTIRSINEISYSTIQKSKHFVSIFDIMNIEQQLFSIIGDLSERNLLLESNDEFQKRATFIKTHTEKLMQFIGNINTTSLNY